SRTRAAFAHLACTLWIFVATAANAQTSAPIDFDGYAPPLPQILGTAWSIFGTGIIDGAATARLRDFLARNHVPSRSTLYLNSDGGNLLEGMRLGRLIRVPIPTQTSLNVVNNGQGPTVWSIESVQGGLYLKGARETWRGMNKFIIVCLPKSGTVLQIFYDSERRGEEIINNFTEHSLYI